jgi:hypothetical protein
MNYIEKIETSRGPADRELMILQEIRSFIRREDAILLFKNAREKLININQWNELVGSQTTCFQLVTPAGQLMEASAGSNSYVRVDIAGKGSETGYGYDWLQIEDWVDMEDENENLSLLSFSLRPSVNPEQKNEKTAHYFSADSSITMLLRREANNVKMSVFETNLVINPVAEKSVAGTIRQTLIGSAGVCGLTNNEWEEIVRNLLEIEMPKPGIQNSPKI